jgi:hypothetical protein
MRWRPSIARQAIAKQSAERWQDVDQDSANTRKVFPDYQAFKEDFQFWKKIQTKHANLETEQDKTPEQD